MNNSFVNVVQKCICIDFLLNALINFNPYEYLKSLISMKDENLKNIKVICQMYESIYKDKLVLEDVPNIKLNKNYENCLNTLLEYNLSLITELEFLKHNPSNHNHYKFLQNLISSYFNSISLINCLYATRLPNTSLFIDNNNIFLI